MFFVKFGSGPRDPVWPIDIYEPQISEAQQIIGFMLADAINGFPVPFYPQCLQRAHSNAALVDFDFDIIQDQLFMVSDKLWVMSLKSSTFLGCKMLIPHKEDMSRR